MLISLLTAAYTAVGGIKAVIWTDVLQIAVLFGALGFSVWYLLGHIPGGWEGVKTHLTGAQDLTLWQWEGDAPADTAWGKIKSVLETEFTVWAALFGSLFVTLATHGTDQDMVQRMLTAKNKRQSAVATILSGLADIPVTYAVLTIGILLSVYYGHVVQRSDTADGGGQTGQHADLPLFRRRCDARRPARAGGRRRARHHHGFARHGDELAGHQLFAGTSISVGSTHRDDDHARVRIIKLATVGFTLVLIFVGLATAFVKAHNPGLSIIGIILGSFGYTYGSLLGVFIVALFTSTRGSEIGKPDRHGRGHRRRGHSQQSSQRSVAE